MKKNCVLDIVIKFSGNVGQSNSAKLPAGYGLVKQALNSVMTLIICAKSEKKIQKPRTGWVNKVETLVAP